MAAAPNAPARTAVCHPSGGQLLLAVSGRHYSEEESWAARDSRTAPGSPPEPKSPHSGRTSPNLTCHKRNLRAKFRKESHRNRLKARRSTTILKIVSAI